MDVQAENVEVSAVDPATTTPEAATTPEVVVETDTTAKEEPTTEEQEQTAAKERDEKGRFKGVQVRIDELTRKRGEAEREAAYWRAQALQGKAPNSANAALSKPTLDQFEDPAEFIEALTDWKADAAVAKRMEADTTRKAVEVRAQTFQERAVALRAELPDYDDVLNASDAVVTEHVGEILQDSEYGPKLAYTFAKDPSSLERLNRMTPVQAAREIGRLEAGFASKVAPPPPAPKKLSQTPPPANPLGQGRSTAPPLANASMEEYVAQRKAQGARWAR